MRKWMEPSWAAGKRAEARPGFPWGRGGGASSGECRKEEKRLQTGVALHPHPGPEGVEAKGSLQSGLNFTPEEINPRELIDQTSYSWSVGESSVLVINSTLD